MDRGYYYGELENNFWPHGCNNKWIVDITVESWKRHGGHEFYSGVWNNLETLWTRGCNNKWIMDFGSYCGELEKYSLKWYLWILLGRLEKASLKWYFLYQEILEFSLYYEFKVFGSRNNIFLCQEFLELLLYYEFRI